ncbi:response regulator [Candidatus Omnitrophota bacterium]
MTKKILVVDDEPSIVDLLGAMLAKSGYEVISALDGKSCLKKAESQKPDLIILDVVMPELDGFAVLDLLKKNQATKKIPVILLTALLKEDDLTKGLKEGANCFISKPFSIIDVLEEIKSALG